jgi:hypothetical protein
MRFLILGKTLKNIQLYKTKPLSNEVLSFFKYFVTTFLRFTFRVDSEKPQHFTNEIYPKRFVSLCRLTIYLIP